MSLSDMLRLKMLANNVGFLRHFFLEPDSDLFASSSTAETSNYSLEIIDCVMAIFLFELSRVTKTGKTLYRRDQI